MTYRAPGPLGLDNQEWTERLSTQMAFTEAATALTDSVLTLDKVISLVDDIDAETLLRIFRERRRRAQRKLTELGMTNGFRADDVDASSTEELRRTWMALKSKVADTPSILKVFVDEEHRSIEKLAGARNRGLPPVIESALSSTISEMEHNLELLNN